MVKENPELSLLKWSKRQAVWQQDLLRRIAAGELLSISDLKNYADAASGSEIRKSKNWYSSTPKPQNYNFNPLEKKHLSSSDSEVDPVFLRGIRHQQGANNLAPNAKLDFETSGITIIAGKNGSGKSGYTRILKQVAASRGSEEVRPNAYQPVVPPKATVLFQVGSDSKISELEWTQDSPETETPLQRVRVFDTRSANMHLSKSSEVAYIPPTLQILGEYTKHLNQISEIISDSIQKAQLDHRVPDCLNNDIGNSILSSLGSSDLNINLNELKPLSDDDEKELQDIPDKLLRLSNSNPAKIAIQARQRARTLSSLARTLEQISESFNSANIRNSISLQGKLEDASAEARKLQDTLDDPNYFEDTGNDAWAKMWRAAKTFANEGIHDHDFPQGALSCPLCGQSLSGETSKRLQFLEDYINNQVQTTLESARSLRKSDRETYLQMEITSLLTTELIALLGTYNDQAADSLVDSLAKAEILRTSLAQEKIVLDLKDANIEELQSELAIQIKNLKSFAEMEIREAEQLEDSDQSAKLSGDLTARQEELTSRQELFKNKLIIGQSHDELVTISCLENAKSACSTRSASHKNSELSRDYVDTVCSQFSVEASNLGLGLVPVELVFDGSSRGVSYLKVRLKNAPSVPVTSVLSEGEQRVAAIAGFFADLAESGDASALVFDDPVSSLDQEYRTRVARRLLEESMIRQVLVFTHDFSFVQYLYEEKSLLDQRRTADGLLESCNLHYLHYLHITRTQDGTGVLTDAASWRHVSVKERIGRLKDRLQTVEAIYRKNDFVKYEKEVRDLVGSLRETWEAFVEQDLLNGVVTRHERSVQTQRLNKLLDITDQDLAKVTLGMTVQSRYMTGHAAPISDGSSPQDPEWIRAEITNLEDFRRAVNRRRT